MKIRISILTTLTLLLSFLVLSCGKDEAQKLPLYQRIDALDNSAWEGSMWISAVDAEVVPDTIKTYRAADGASWFVSTVKNEKRVASAKWMTAGLGVYDLFVNGKRIGDEILKPGYTTPQKTKLSFTYDVTGAFTTDASAENTLSVQVTPGWWADKIATSKKRGLEGKKCAFRGVLELTFEDGTKSLYGTDLENWKAGIAGPVKHAGIFDGEEYDAREKMGWEVADQLKTPEENTEFKGEIVPSNGAEVYFRHDLTLSPVRAYVYNGIEGATDEAFGKVVIVREYKLGDEIELDKGETLIVDFGQNCAGVPSFEFKAAEGATLTCLPSEILNDGNGAKERGMDGPEGSVFRRSLRSAEHGMRVVYTFADGDEYVSYHPRYTFYGYRYIAVTATDKVSFKSVKSIPISSISKELEAGKIVTGNESVNKILSNTYWGELSNYLSIPTDCPQRNERLGWTADAQVFAETGTFFADTKDFFHKWMRDMRDCQCEKGSYNCVAPTGPYGKSRMRFGWADAGVITPWVIWKQYADTQIIDECWASMELFVDYINSTKYDHNAHLDENQGKQYADWLSYEPLETYSVYYSKEVEVEEAEIVGYWNFLSASYWAIDARCMADMAAATGRDAEKYIKMETEAKAYIKEKFLNADGTFKTAVLNTMQTPALFALKVGVVEGDAKEAMIARLRKNFEEHGNCLQTGFLGTSILMQMLTENGMVDIAYELLFQRKNPSWLYSIDNGATTIWERWNSYTLEEGISKHGMNSFNHYAYGCVCEWIWETVAGIACDASAPGFKHIIMRPIPDKRLGFVNAEYNSAAGLIKSAWRYEGDKWIWEFTIPVGATASVTLPGESEPKHYDSGTYTVVQ